METMREAESDGERAAGSSGVPNWLLDACLTDLSDTEVQALLFIRRWTAGAGQETAIGYDRFVDGIGIKDRATLAQALASLELRGHRLWDALTVSRVLHRHQVEALRSIVVGQWDAERLVLAPWSAAVYREACKHKVDVQRFVAQAGQSAVWSWLNRV
jgi:hypothetical protein